MKDSTLKRIPRHFLIFTIVFFGCLFSPFNLKAEDKKQNKQPSNSVNEITESRNQIIKFTDRGIVPSELKIKKEDSIVFFLNDTSSSLTSLVVDFGSKVTHCGGAKMQNGKVSTARPFGPNDFASTCFHESGVYPFKVFGIKSNPRGLESKIYVE